ncbi:hypothetical protein [Halocynthiibacter namhaensis]|uniref:hypothetical protein n=1 Tax=Halocynthiibacter namhaensis TaxID=1290553 RepID=UPI0005798E62|nr:hypothetical protein [Halocynthiibacter namhaensis]
MKKLILIAHLVLMFFVTACGVTPGSKDPADFNAEIAALTQEIIALDASIDPTEAARAARISVEYPLQLRQDWNVTDSAIVHNIKVNSGRREMGLCYQWADALQARLAREEFQTLAMHRAIANAQTLRLEHSTVILSAVGETMNEGIILDPWRYGGTLFWAPLLEDTRYTWIARENVFAEKRRRGQL